MDTSMAAPAVPPDLAAVNERLARLEGSFDGFKTVLAIFAGVLGLLTTITIAGFVFLNSRIDRLETGFEARLDRIEVRVGTLEAGVTALPVQINNNVRELTATLAQAMLASKQTPPQVILLPPPPPQSPEPPAK